MQQLFTRIRDKLRQPVAYRVDIKTEDRSGFLKVAVDKKNTTGIVTGATQCIGIILVSSGSMRQRDRAGKRRNQSAFKALKNIIAKLPNGLQTALFFSFPHSAWEWNAFCDAPASQDAGAFLHEFLRRPWEQVFFTHQTKVSEALVLFFLKNVVSC